MVKLSPRTLGFYDAHSSLVTHIAETVVTAHPRDSFVGSAAALLDEQFGGTTETYHGVYGGQHIAVADFYAPGRDMVERSVRVQDPNSGKPSLEIGLSAHKITSVRVQEPGSSTASSGSLATVYTGIGIPVFDRWLYAKRAAASIQVSKLLSDVLSNMHDQS